MHPRGHADSSGRSNLTLARRIAQGATTVAITFAGQGTAVLDELAAILGDHAALRSWIDLAQSRLDRWMSHRDFQWSGAYPAGFDLRRWLANPDSRPDVAVLRSTAITNPMIFVAQILRYLALREEGLSWQPGAVTAITGHSQGIMPSLLVSESEGGIIAPDRFAAYLDYMCWQGLAMTRSYRGVVELGDQGPMAAVSGPDRDLLGGIITACNARLPVGQRLFLTLENTRTRNVVSGTPASLLVLREALTAAAARDALARKEGRLGGKPLTFSWENLAVGGPFHSDYMAPGLQIMRAAVAEMGFVVDGSKLQIPVISPVDGSRWQEDVTERLLVAQFLQPVRWPAAVTAAAQGAEWVLDLGPGDGVARLSRGALRGTGTRVLSLSSGTASPARDLAVMFSEGATEPVRPACWADAAPVLREHKGTVYAENPFVRATGLSPVILPGMTPTTVDVPIVAAAANAGFWAELAGGGQVTEAIFWRRMDQLALALDPGREVVFNALFLDPYLWGLHLGAKALVQRARRRGYPISGVVVSAGLPEQAAALRLLDELAGLGMRNNAFKPGTAAQIEAVAKIAEAAPEHRIFVHIEGGKAGGHHSWEDLETLLLDSYGRLRDLDNVILCAGGGIADQSRAVSLLTGEWSVRRGLLPMPVDAVLLGTLAMATAEATASPAVKAALVAASGAPGWVSAGQVEGGITSGKSQLNADIHYLENAAARAGRLLDQVAGDADKVAARRDELITALNATAKPYFGDIESMTWTVALRRLWALLAVGRGRLEEDGPWPDISYRQRAAQLLWRAEARLGAGGGAVTSLVGADLAELDDPDAVLDAFEAAYPQSAATLVHPADARHFVRRICASPGKPVNFVPVIDADVRRWYKADSLWQAQDDRYPADAVLVIPGPEAVAGIHRADEPVAELLGRFDAALVAALPGVPVARAHGALAGLPAGLTVEAAPTGLILHADRPVSASWLEVVAASFTGPLAGLLVADAVSAGDVRAPNPARAVLVAEAGSCFELEIGADDALLSLRERAAGLHLQVRDGGVLIALSLGAGRLVQQVSAQQNERGFWSFAVNPERERESLRQLYLSALPGGSASPVALFDRADEAVVVDGARLAAMAATTGAPDAHVPLNSAFSLAFRAIFRTLCADELAGGLLRLVHLDNEIEAGPAWPPRGGETIAVSAAVSRLEDAEQGRTVAVCAELLRGDVRIARLTSRFFLRAGGNERYGQRELQLELRESISRRLHIATEAELEFLASHAWIQPTATLTPGVYEIQAQVSEARPRQGEPRFVASGALLRAGQRVATLDLDETGAADIHPLLAFVATLGGEGGPRPAGARTLAELALRSPSLMALFADLSGDHNPIHRSTLAARLAGLPGPIVHGQWTATRLESLVAAMAGANQISSLRARFLAPLSLDVPVQLSLVRSGLDQGAVVLEGSARTEAGAVLGATITLAAPRTAIVFPGQGVQRQGMGLDGRGRSAAAASVWSRADAITTAECGFSILRVVRDNPPRIDIDGVRYQHPEGVLHLTAFTQVALAVLAAAQMAELREAGALPGAEGASLIGAGHSLGEYNAIGALFEVLPLETVVAAVWARGLTMHGLVPRDSRGESGYRMGVVRPNLARLDHAGAEALVASVAADTGEFVQIVNYNVRDRQYAVTGKLGALAELQKRLAARVPDGGKPAWVEVPGIDVPFHSSELASGAPAFRASLDRIFPADIPTHRLVGRYVPNLVARVFSLERDFVAAVADASRSPVLDQILANWEVEQPGDLGRTLLIELLAWQFCSPVRWIETVELLLAGPAPVDRFLEVGVGYAPTLANMARTAAESLGLSIPVLNSEADRVAVFALDEDEGEDSPVEVEPSAPAPSSPAATPVAAPSRPASAGTPAAGTPAAGTPAAGTPADAPLSAAEAVRGLLALSARVRPEQIRETETIDELFDGVSSRRNQVLLDLGAEFNAGGLDGAQDKALGLLVTEIGRKPYRGPGKVLRAAGDDAIKRLFGRYQLGRAQIGAHIEQRYGLGAGWAERVILALTLESREGPSARGGALGDPAAPDNKDAALARLERVAAAVAGVNGLALADNKPAESAVDPAAVKALEDKLLGPDGALAAATRALATGLGQRLVSAEAAPVAAVLDSRVAEWEAEHGAAYADLIRPLFSTQRHVAFLSTWAWAQRDVARLYLETADLAAEAGRLAAFAADPRVSDTARWYATRAARQGLGELEAALTRVAEGRDPAPYPTAPTRPHLEIAADGGLLFRETADPAGLSGWLDSLMARPDQASLDREDGAWRQALRQLSTSPISFAGRNALITGASPGSIAVEVAARLLRGGARVVLTTSTLDEGRLLFYRRLFQKAAGPGAALHVLPCNQGCLRDVAALLDWLTSQDLSPDLLLPFAAIKEAGSTGQDMARAAAALRVQLLGVEALIIGAAARGRCQVVLPLSPNHGAFGGDGAYAETKAALEVLLEKVSSERDSWGAQVSLIGARIGWVRGTGLMDGNNPVSAKLEEQTGVRTFSSAEMGFLITGLCALPWVQGAVRADLCGGFGEIPDLRGTVSGIRAEIAQVSAHKRRVSTLLGEESRLLARPTRKVHAAESLLDWPVGQEAQRTASWPKIESEISRDLRRVVVVVGAGELGPWGSARTRFEIEVDDALSGAGVLELAWTLGLLRPDGQGGWLDGETEESVAEATIPARYREAVMGASGIRWVEPAITGYDPAKLPVLATAWLERDLRFPVGSAEEAGEFQASDPEHTRIEIEGGTWYVTRKAGSAIRVPRSFRLDRNVAGMLPTGFDPTRFGVPAELVGQVDRVALMNLIATADAFLSAGLSPEELLAAVHPARVGNTQGSGLGGGTSLKRLYLDSVLGENRQLDALQETLINVIAAHVVQGFIGSYGVMSNPVSACATAAVSLEEGMDKILLGKAEFVVAGGYDDLSSEGAVGFNDMAATASTDEMTASGVGPRAISRPNDRRRHGFVEAQGGGTLLLARGDLALKLGLPVCGVLAYAGSFSDGINRSIPAPGLGALAAGLGGRSSPLGTALSDWGLDADDIALVYKHDTSTNANDSNENRLHHHLQVALGRTPGNPLFVVSQKSITGHAKGGSAAWQAIGLMQSMASGVIAGNRNLESVDEAMRPFAHMAFSDTTLRSREPLRAGLLTSLGFGHVSALCLLLHPDAFVAALPEAARAEYLTASNSRKIEAKRARARVMLGETPMYARRNSRRLPHADGSEAQLKAEIKLLTDETMRLDQQTGLYRSGSEDGDLA